MAFLQPWFTRQLEALIYTWIFQLVGADIILLWTILRCRDWTVVRFCHTLGPVMLLQALYVSSLISSTSTRHYRLNRSCEVGCMLRQHHEWTLLSDFYFIEDREPDSVFHLLVSDCS